MRRAMRVGQGLCSGTRASRLPANQTAALLFPQDSRLILERVPLQSGRPFQVIIVILSEMADQGQAIGRRFHEYIDEWEARFKCLIAAHTHDTTHDG